MIHFKWRWCNLQWFGLSSSFLTKFFFLYVIDFRSRTKPSYIISRTWEMKSWSKTANLSRSSSKTMMGRYMVKKVRLQRKYAKRNVFFFLPIIFFDFWFNTFDPWIALSFIHNGVIVTLARLSSDDGLCHLTSLVEGLINSETEGKRIMTVT